MIKIIEKIMTIMLWPVIHFSLEVLDNAPHCCGKPMDFLQEHVGLFEVRRFEYQCSKCKLFKVVYPKPRPLWELWRMIFMPTHKKDCESK